MPKRPSLAESMESVQQALPPHVPKRPSLAESMKSVQQAPPAPHPVIPAEPAHSPGKPYFAATRVGLKRITVAVDPAEHRRLKRLSADTGRSIEDLMREALTDLFRKLS